MRLSPIPKLDYKSPSTWLALWFGCGLMKPGPGTWGTIGALPFGVILLAVCGPLGPAMAAALSLYPGIKAADRIIAATGDHDPKFVVVDEVVGMWIALIPAVLSPVSVILAFALFRLFDIWKPWPVSHFDRNIKGGLGVMMDDVMAGVMAALCIVGLSYAGIH